MRVRAPISSSSSIDVDGNKYFRDLIQKNIGPYLTSRTKVEKGDAINRIIDMVKQNNPFGGFVRKDPSSGRWLRMKDHEARDKVGHAIRKAVQRLEATKPKLAARLKKEFNGVRTSKMPPADDGFSQQQQVRSNSHHFTGASDVATPKEDRKGESTIAASSLMLHQTSMPASDALDHLMHIAAAAQSQQSTQPHAHSSTPTLASFAEASSSVGLAMRSALFQTQVPSAPSLFPLWRHDFSNGASALPSRSLMAGSISDSRHAILSSAYDQLLALKLREQQTRSNNELAIILALQQQEEGTLRREIGNAYRRLPTPVPNNLDSMLPLFSVRSQFASSTNVPGLANIGVNPLTLASLGSVSRFPSLSGPAATLTAYSEALKALEAEKKNQQRRGD